MWVQGTIVNVCGSILVNLAANLLKLAHNVEETDKLSPAKQEVMTGLTEALKYGAFRRCCFPFYGSHIYASKLYWRLGAFLFAAGSVINFLSLSMAAQSLLATLGGVQFVSNIFFARLILGERVTKRGLLATAVIIVGLTVAVSFSDHASTRYTASGLIALYDQVYISFIACVVAILVLAECTYLLYTSREKAGNPLLYSSIVRPVTYSIVSATVGTQSVLQSKCLAELLRTDIVLDRANGSDLFANVFFYIVVTAFLVGMAFWLYRLNNALKLFDGLVIIPIIQVFWVTSAVLQGGMFFKEFEEMSTKQSLLFASGVITVFFGVYLIATSQSNNDDDSHHLQSIDGDKDRLTDPELAEGHRPESEPHRKRSEHNDRGDRGEVMIITCIGSPFKYEKTRKFGNKMYSTNSSSKSSNYDGCDRYYDEFSAIEALQEEEDGNEKIKTGNEVDSIGRGEGEIELRVRGGEGGEEESGAEEKEGDREDLHLSSGIVPAEAQTLLLPRPSPSLNPLHPLQLPSLLNISSPFPPIGGIIGGIKGSPSVGPLGKSSPSIGPLGAVLGAISPSFGVISGQKGSPAVGPIGVKSPLHLQDLDIPNIIRDNNHNNNNSNSSSKNSSNNNNVNNNSPLKNGSIKNGKSSPLKDIIKGKSSPKKDIIVSRGRSQSACGLLEENSGENSDENEENDG